MSTGPSSLAMQFGRAVPNEAVYMASFALIPLAVGLLWVMVRSHRWRGVAALFFLPVALLVYARFIEPQWLRVEQTGITICGDGLPGTLRAGVVADFHYGVFKNALSLNRVVNRLNREDVDFVLMPGDFTSHLDTEDVAETFAPFSRLRMPAYAVMGNHDVGLPGENVVEPLTEALEANGVTVLNPGEAVFQKNGKFLRIVGQRDYWDAEENDLPLMSPTPPHVGMPIIYLQHNAQALVSPKMGGFDLMVSGHTHGGQIMVPWLTCRFTFACEILRYGYADTPLGKLFVTSGIGMTGLPMRFGVPPRIDVLELTIDRCREPAPHMGHTNKPGFNPTEPRR